MYTPICTPVYYATQDTLKTWGQEVIKNLETL